MSDYRIWAWSDGYNRPTLNLSTDPDLRLQQMMWVRQLNYFCPFCKSTDKALTTDTGLIMCRNKDCHQVTTEQYKNINFIDEAGKPVKDWPDSLIK